MTTVVLLVRHAHTDAVGRIIAGRAAGVPLSAAGRAQADHLGRTLASVPLAAIYTGPLERAIETARAIARHHTVPVREDAALDEVDFGEWTGLTLSELEDIEGWRAFNTDRATAVIPGGEVPLMVQRRIVDAIERLAAAHPGTTIALVSHGDVIRSAVLHVAGSSLDLYHRFEISPASITAVEVAGTSRRLLYVNNTHRGASA
jgi:broad specificity phosphatase PhoE